MELLPDKKFLSICGILIVMLEKTKEYPYWDGALSNRQANQEGLKRYAQESLTE
jgi:hypothetical protein